MGILLDTHDVLRLNTIPSVVTGDTLIIYDASTGILSLATVAQLLSGINTASKFTGTFTANGATPVAVSDTNVAAGCEITFTLKTVGGTVGAYPSIKTRTNASGFTVACTAGDTSVYDYTITLA